MYLRKKQCIYMYTYIYVCMKTRRKCLRGASTPTSTSHRRRTSMRPDVSCGSLARNTGGGVLARGRWRSLFLSIYTSVFKSLWSSRPKMTLACFWSAIVPIAYPAAGKRVLSLQRVRARHLNHQLLSALGEPLHLYPCWTKLPGRCTEALLTRDWHLA